jgi:hypothetical protein
VERTSNGHLMRGPVTESTGSASAETECQRSDPTLECTSLRQPACCITVMDIAIVPVVVPRRLDHWRTKMAHGITAITRTYWQSKRQAYRDTWFLFYSLSFPRTM